MSEKNSQGWTGDYPKEAHYSLASEEGRRRHRRLAVAILSIAAIGIAAALIWQGLR